MSYDVFNDDIKSIDIDQDKIIVNCMNPHTYIVAKKMICLKNLYCPQIFFFQMVVVVLAADY